MTGVRILANKYRIDFLQNEKALSKTYKLFNSSTELSTIKTA